MRVTCPDCAAAFEMPESAIDDAGRRVRCGACAHVWRVYPEADAAPAAETAEQPGGFGAGQYEAVGNEAGARPGEAVADDPFAALQESMAQAMDDGMNPAADDGDAPVLTAYSAGHDDDDISPVDDDALYGAAGLPALPPRRSRLVAFGWIAYIVFIAVLAGGLVLFRAPLVNAWPPLDGVYKLFEESRPTAETAFRVDVDPEPAWQESGDGWTMTISGRVTNVYERSLALPPLRIELVDQRNASVRAEEAKLERRKLGPGESAAFTAIIENAPEQARGIDYRWETPGE